MSAPVAAIEAVPWHALHHAHGPAVHAPRALCALWSRDTLLRQRAADHDFDSLVHQGTRYEATAAAVPFVLAAARDPEVLLRHRALYWLAHVAAGWPCSWAPQLRSFQPAERACLQAVCAGLPLYRSLLSHPDALLQAASARLLALCEDPDSTSFAALRASANDSSRDARARAHARLAAAYLDPSNDDLLDEARALCAIPPTSIWWDERCAAEATLVLRARVLGERLRDDERDEVLDVLLPALETTAMEPLANHEEPDPAGDEWSGWVLALDHDDPTFGRLSALEGVALQPWAPALLDRFERARGDRVVAGNAALLVLTAFPWRSAERSRAGGAPWSDEQVQVAGEVFRRDEFWAPTVECAWVRGQLTGRAGSPPMHDRDALRAWLDSSRSR